MLSPLKFRHNIHFMPSISHNIEERDAQTIGNALQPVLTKWYEIGFALKVKTIDLDRIEEEKDQLTDKMLVSSWHIYSARLL